MADEDITLDGKPLQSLRVADLKAALEQRNLSKSGQKNALIKRLKGVSFARVLRVKFRVLAKLDSSKQASSSSRRRDMGLTLEAVAL